MVVKITNEEFIDVTLAMGGQIYNFYKLRNLVAKFITNGNGTTS